MDSDYVVVKAQASRNHVPGGYTVQSIIVDANILAYWWWFYKHHNYLCGAEV